MAGDPSSESLHDRRVTWGLMAVVILFVLIMSAIVLWITTSLIRNELNPSGPAQTTSQPAVEKPVVIRSTPTGKPGQAGEAVMPGIPATSQAPMLVDGTWTPPPKSNGYVKYLYWYVKPNKITVGECVQVTWETANAVSLQLFRNDELILDNAPAAQTLQDCPKQPGYAVYRMVGVNSEGESNWIQLQVKVVKAPQAAP
jgi:hypothetical protein